MSQKLHDDLTKAGFTDISIMPAVVAGPRQGCAGQFGDDGDQSGFADRGDDKSESASGG